MLSEIRHAFRTQRMETFQATLILFMVPWLTAGGELFTWLGIGLGGMIFFVHGSINLHNVVEDYELDKQDPAKQHLPLMLNVLKYSTAVRITGPYLFVVGILMTVVSLWLAPTRWKAITALLLMLTAGHWYNDASYSSRSRLAFVPHMIWWISMTAWAWFLESSEVTILFWLLLLFVAVRIWFQISVSGRLKDIRLEVESNELRTLGATLTENSHFTPSLSYWYAIGLMLLEIIIAGIILNQINASWPVWLGTGLLMGMGLLVTHLLIRPQHWDRENQLRRMGTIEGLNIYALLIIFVDRIGTITVLSLMVFGLIWSYTFIRWISEKQLI